MTDEQIATAIELANRPLVQALGDVKTQLSALARVQMLDVLYSRDDARRLVATYKELQAQEHAAREARTTKRKGGKADDRLLADSKSTQDTLGEFSSRHPLIAELVQSSSERE